MTCVLILTVTAPPAASEIQSPAITVTAPGKGDDVRTGAENGSLVIDVQSERGIGEATVALDSEDCPKTIRVRLHTKGLEGFHLTCGEKMLNAAVSSIDSNTVSQSLISSNGQEQPITADSPLRLNIGIVGTRIAPAIPLQSGWFEITLPQDCLCTGSRSFSMRWIDFYR